MQYNKKEIKSLISKGFSTTKISSTLKIPKTSLCRFMNENNLHTKTISIREKQSEYIKKHYKTSSYKDIAEHLKKSEQSIKIFVHRYLDSKYNTA